MIHGGLVRVEEMFSWFTAAEMTISLAIGQWLDGAGFCYGTKMVRLHQGYCLTLCWWLGDYSAEMSSAILVFCFFLLEEYS
jgi:hypothetical protein